MDCGNRKYSSNICVHIYYLHIDLRYSKEIALASPLCETIPHKIGRIAVTLRLVGLTTGTETTDAIYNPPRTVRTLFPTIRYHALVSTPTFIIGLAVLPALVSTPVAAQQQVGSGICGTPLADTVNYAAPLFIGITMIASAILAYILHNAAAFPKKPQTIESVKGWRNRAAFATVTTPLFAVVIEQLIGATGVGLASCVDIVPFF